MSRGSGLTVKAADEPPEEEEVVASDNRRGIHEMPWRREKDGGAGAGYLRRGVLPASM